MGSLNNTPSISVSLTCSTNYRVLYPANNNRIYPNTEHPDNSCINTEFVTTNYASNDYPKNAHMDTEYTTVRYRNDSDRVASYLNVDVPISNHPGSSLPPSNPLAHANSTSFLSYDFPEKARPTWRQTLAGALAFGSVVQIVLSMTAGLALNKDGNIRL